MQGATCSSGALTHRHKSHQEGFGIQCLAQGHLEMQAGGAGARTTDRYVGGALPSDPRPSPI